MRQIKLALAVAVMFTGTLILAATARASIYTYTTLDGPSGARSRSIEGINNGGDIFGHYQDSSHEHGFLYSSGAYTTLNAPNGALNTYPDGINDSGEIVGTYQDSSVSEQGFLYSGGVYTTLNDPYSAGGTYPADINYIGDITGYYYDGSLNAHGFLYSPGASSYIGGSYMTIDDPNGFGETYPVAINDSDEIVGYYYDSSGNTDGFLYSAGTYTTINDPNGTGSVEIAGINDSGEIIGNYYDSSDNRHGFLYSAGAYTTVDDPNGISTTVSGINDNGDIVGSYTDSSGDHGFVYSGGAYTTIDDPNGTENTYPVAISDSGEIIGNYRDSSNGNYYGFLAAPLWQNAKDLGSGWKWLSWFGYFYTGSSPWIYHEQHGWLYPVGTSTASIWFWDSSMGAFWWTSATVYPYVYRASDNAWLYYDVGTSNPRWFYNYKTGAWEKD